MPLIQERLEAGQKVRYLSFRGVSMLPMLRQDLDSVELAPLPEQLHKYDLPVYRYPSGKYVMHRIVRVNEGMCLCLGDNTYEYEHIPRQWMIGVVSSFKRGDQVISVENPGYRLYCRVWCAIFPLRKLLRRIKNRLRRILK